MTAEQREEFCRYLVRTAMAENLPLAQLAAIRRFYHRLQMKTYFERCNQND